MSATRHLESVVNNDARQRAEEFHFNSFARNAVHELHWYFCAFKDVTGSSLPKRAITSAKTQNHDYAGSSWSREKRSNRRCLPFWRHRKAVQLHVIRRQICALQFLCFNGISTTEKAHFWLVWNVQERLQVCSLHIDLYIRLTFASSCTSRSHHGQHGKGRGLKMDCGHSLSPYAIRIHVQEANQRDGHAIPSCCGIPLPMQALDIVTEKNAAGLISSSTSPSPEPASARDSGYCDQSMSSVELARPNAIPSPPATSTSLPLPPTRRRYEAISIDSALANEAFKSFRTEQKEQFEKVSTFECNQRTALSAYHATSLRRLTVQQDASRDEKMSQVRPLGQITASHELTCSIAYTGSRPSRRVANHRRTRLKESPGH